MSTNPASSPLPFFHDWIRKGGLKKWLYEQIRDAEWRDESGIEYDEASDVMSGMWYTGDPQADPYICFRVEDRHRELIRAEVDNAKASIRSAVAQHPHADSLTRFRLAVLREIDDLRRRARESVDERRLECILEALDEIEDELRLITGLASTVQPPAKKTRSGNPNMRRRSTREDDLALFAEYIQLLDQYPPRRPGEVSKGMKAELLDRFPGHGSISTIRRRIDEVGASLSAAERRHISANTGVKDERIREEAGQFNKAK